MLDPDVQLFATAFGVSGLGGLAALLRSSQKVTRKSVATYTLNTGAVGLAIALIWYTQFRDNLQLLVGLCVVAGLSGMASVDFLLEATKRFSRVMTKEQTKE